MKTQVKENLKMLHFEHMEWMNKLEFYKSEMDVFEKLLGEVAIKNNTHETRSNVEHFQNQFILHKERLDELKHDVNKSESAIVNQLMDSAIAWDRQSIKPQDDLRAAMQTFDYLFIELKKEFKKFLEQIY